MPISQTILLIEDDPALQRTLRAVLARWFPAAHIVLADTASRAIAVLSMALVDLVVSDYDLGDPGSNGGDVLTWVRAHRPGLEERFCFMSGSDRPRQIHRHALAKGGDPVEQRAYLTQLLAPATF